MKWTNSISLLVICFSLTGCMSLGILAGGVGTSAAIGGGTLAAQGKRTSFSDRGTFELSLKSDNVLDLAADVGKEMGYSAERISRNTLNLNSGTSAGAMMASSFTMGIATKDIIMLSLTQSDEKRLDYSIILHGKFGDNPTKAADGIIADFKSKLEKRITELAEK